MPFPDNFQIPKNKDMLKAHRHCFSIIMPIDFWLIFQCQWVMQSFQDAVTNLISNLTSATESYLQWRPCLIFNHLMASPHISPPLLFFQLLSKAIPSLERTLWGWRKPVVTKISSGLACWPYNRLHIFISSVSQSPPQYRIAVPTTRDWILSVTCGCRSYYPDVDGWGSSQNRALKKRYLYYYFYLLFPSFQPLPHLYLAAYSRTKYSFPQPLWLATFQSISCFLDPPHHGSRYCPLYWLVKSVKLSVLLPSIIQKRVTW